jgi:hypothetical protein
MVAQVGTLYLRDGESTGYQLLSFTPKSSLSPAIFSDDLGHIYITWLERLQGSGYNVYFASTAADIQEALNPITRGDVFRMIADTFFGLLKGAVFSLLYAPLWLAIPGLLLALTVKFRKDSNSLLSVINFSSLVVAIIVYWGGKLFSLGNINSYVPFSAWIPVIPSWMKFPLQLGAPILGTVIALMVAWHYANRGGTKSAAQFFFIYAGIDCLITLALYGELLFARF